MNMGRIVLIFVCAVFILMLAACKSPTLPGEGKITPVAPRSPDAIDSYAKPDKAAYLFGVPLVWDPEFQAPPCSVETDDTPVFNQALSTDRLSKNQFGFTRTDLANSPYYITNILQGGSPFLWHENLLANPAYAGCFEGEIVGALKYHLNGAHPVSNAIRDAAVVMGVSPDALRQAVGAEANSFETAISELCALVGECGEPAGEIPPELTKDLTPLIQAIIAGIAARKQMDGQVGAHHDSEWWRLYGGNLIMIGTERPDLTNDVDRAYILDESGARNALYIAASRIANAVENIDWSLYNGRMSINYDLITSAGWIQIRDGANHKYPNDGKDILLRLDLGGNDIHADPTASNTSARNAVSVDIDLSGSDIRTYESTKTSYDKEGLLEADKYGRFPGNERYGNISLSQDCRQGAGQNGIALLFDFGQGNDHYQSLRCSQGYTHGGVGVLFDEGGNNTFLSEITSQGSSQFGIALRLIKGKGANLSKSFSYSQGFGFARGAGIDISGSGNDTNICDQGDPAQGGIPLYYTPQLPGKGNSSFCQGAGFGVRSAEEKSWKEFLAGGIGIKLDLGGNNTFVASVFSQGVGYWQGTGILDVQGNGDNTFDALWYGQGAAAHHAVGMFFRSGEGKDTLNEKLKPVAIMLGAGHDFSAGIFINDTGNATFHIPLLSAGASNCNGLGLFVINKGNNKLIADTQLSSAVANVQCANAEIFSYLGGDDEKQASPEYRKSLGDTADWSIPTSIDTKSASIMMIVGENNTYEYPQGSESSAPRENGSWTNKRNVSDHEYSGGISAPEGETGIHAESGRIK